MSVKSGIIEVSRRGVLCLTGHKAEQHKCILPYSEVWFNTLLRAPRLDNRLPCGRVFNFNLEVTIMPPGHYPHKPHSEETKRKMSESHKGHPVSEETRRKFSEANKKRGWVLKPGANRKWNEASRRRWSEKQKGQPGHKHTDEERARMSERQRGERAPNWKGGVTPHHKLARSSAEYKVWRAAVYERDNHTCAKCQVRGGDLHPHHIHNFAEHEELRFDVANGITLCVGCHRRFHKLYGRINNNQLQLDDFLQSEAGA